MISSGHRPAVRPPDEASAGVPSARRTCYFLTLIAIDTATFEAAGRLEPPSLGPLDALHLAVALELGDDLEGLVTYDERLATACRANGVPVSAPV